MSPPIRGPTGPERKRRPAWQRGAASQNTDTEKPLSAKRRSAQERRRLRLIRAAEALFSPNGAPR